MTDTAPSPALIPIDPKALEVAWEAYNHTAGSRDKMLENAIRAYLAALRDAGWSVTKQPINMLLWCPQCHTQHVDEPDARTEGWNTPLHRSHLCHNCGTIWRPADIPTNGIVAISTRGKADTWPPPPPEPRDG